MSSLEYQDLCRLCLVKDDVSVPIFEDVGDIHQICNKITTCLPVKVTKEDKLPQKLCNNCVYKVESFYQFWHQTLNVEKQLLQWLENAEKQGYSVGTVFNQSGMKDQSNENRLVGNVMQQVSIHQSNMNMDMDNMGVCMPMMMTGNNQQQITSVPMDTSGSSIQNIQAITGSNTQATHDQITQTQTNTSTQQEEEDESSEDEENSDDECDGDDGLPIKEESEEDPNNSRTIEPTTFVNVSLACEDPGPSGLQQQKMADIQEMAQATDVDPKTGEAGETFGGLSGMLRQILSPSPETGEIGMSSVNCTLLQNNSIYTNQSSMLSSTLLNTIPPHFQSVCPDQSLFDQMQILAEFYPCPTCGLEFRSVLKLNYHMRTSHAARPEYEHHNIENQPRYSCSVCSRSFVSLSHLKLHELTHTTAPVTSCASTSAGLVSPDGGGGGGGGGGSAGGGGGGAGGNGNGNMDKMFSCDLCRATFRYRTLLERHRRMHDIDPEKLYSCPRCLMRFETRNLYNHHAKTHRPIPATGGNDNNRMMVGAPNTVVSSVVDPVAAANLGGPIMPAAKSMTSYPCDSCSKQFTTAESLTTHKAVHRPRPLVCNVCGKGFTHRKYYVVHQRIHTGERPYLCAMCGKSFTQASTLTVHRRYHTGERPYTCTFCGKGFVTRTIMLNHMKKH